MSLSDVDLSMTTTHRSMGVTSRTPSRNKPDRVVYTEHCTCGVKVKSTDKADLGRLFSDHVREGMAEVADAVRRHACGWPT